MSEEIFMGRLVVLKVVSCFLAHHEQGAPDTLSSLRLSAAVCTFDCYCNTSTVTVCACINVCSNSSDTSNANNFCVF